VNVLVSGASIAGPVRTRRRRGSTSLAVVGAFTLAGELAVAGGDHTVAFPACERAMADYVRHSRAFAVSVAF